MRRDMVSYTSAMTMRKTELLAPAGNFATARAAFAAGADAVYCGLKDFSARSFADNFSFEEMRDLLCVARAQSKKVYVTFNTVIDEADFPRAVRTLARLEDLRPDGVIVQDLGVARVCRRHFPGLALHASTQLVAHNLEGVLAMREIGFSRVVLARELSLAEISSIVKRCGVEIETFIHGALCYSVSGLCLFSAMEKHRSGNRGQCAYCCRLPYEDNAGVRSLPFSMRDMRLGADVAKLAEAGVASLKIEGRMKSEVYVASAVRYYRQILDKEEGRGKKEEVGERKKEEGGFVTEEDLETVFSRRTTRLYFDGVPSEPVIDPDSLGHLGAEIGVVKRVTRDPDGSAWLRFHTLRRLEKHDGLQFASPDGGKPLGMGIGVMRAAISRAPVFDVPAGADVEILIPEDGDRSSPPLAALLQPGMKVHCSASQAVRRMFPVPPFRPSDYPGGDRIDIAVSLCEDGVSASVAGSGVECSVPADLSPAKSPERTAEAVRTAFSKLGGTDYVLGKLSVDDPNKLFAPPRILNDLRRELVERLDEARARKMEEKISAALGDEPSAGLNPHEPRAVRRLKIRAGQPVPAGDWDEIVVVMGEGGDRVATPVYTSETDFPKLRAEAKRLIHRGRVRWEASDLATLRMLRGLGVEDLTADWTLFAFNSQALRELADLGVKRFVTSPENCADNLRALAESGFDVEILAQQSTPLFISLTEPAARPADLAVFKLGRLWVTTKSVPRTFDVPPGAASRCDLSWDPM